MKSLSHQLTPSFIKPLLLSFFIKFPSIHAFQSLPFEFSLSSFDTKEETFLQKMDRLPNELLLAIIRTVAASGIHDFFQLQSNISPSSQTRR